MAAITETTMSPDVVLLPLMAAAHCVRDHRGNVRGAEMDSAVATVAAMIEREAALVAERDALREALQVLASICNEYWQDGYNSAIRFVLGYLNGAGDCGSTAYEEILRECGSVEIIRSAIEDGEMEFTGLDSWTAENGTPSERAAARAEARNG